MLGPCGDGKAPCTWPHAAEKGVQAFFPEVVELWGYGIGFLFSSRGMNRGASFPKAKQSDLCGCGCVCLRKPQRKNNQFPPLPEFVRGFLPGGEFWPRLSLKFAQTTAYALAISEMLKFPAGNFAPPESSKIAVAFPLAAFNMKRVPSKTANTYELPFAQKPPGWIEWFAWSWRLFVFVLVKAHE